jgi:anti-sigma B factor antagonist
MLAVRKHAFHRLFRDEPAERARTGARLRRPLPMTLASRALAHRADEPASAPEDGTGGEGTDAGQRNSDIRELRPSSVTESVVVIRLAARRLDWAAEPTLRAIFAAAWHRRASTVVLDLSDVVYVDSLGLSALIAQHRNRPRGARIVVCSLAEQVRDVFEVTRLVSMFDVFASAEAAVGSLAA